MRLHYSNCKAYNADFDGDEMNAHFPQNEVARSEGYNIGIPISETHRDRVFIKNSMLSSCCSSSISSTKRRYSIGWSYSGSHDFRCTTDDPRTIFQPVKTSIHVYKSHYLIAFYIFRSDYQQLVFAGLGGRSYNGTTTLLPPAILKPVPLWSGKQVLSTIVLNLTPKGKPLINMDSTAKIGFKDWQTCPPRPWQAGGTPLKSPVAMTESEVIFRQGELVCGVLDKMHYGATSYGLIHSFSELYGGQYSCRLLSSFSRLFTSYLQFRGFTLGVKDILVTRKADKKRSKIIKQLKTVGFVLKSAIEASIF